MGDFQMYQNVQFRELHFIELIDPHCFNGCLTQPSNFGALRTPPGLLSSKRAACQVLARRFSIARRAL